MGTSWNSRKGGILEKGGLIYKKVSGGLWPASPTMTLVLYNLFKNSYKAILVKIHQIYRHVALRLKAHDLSAKSLRQVH